MVSMVNLGGLIFIGYQPLETDKQYNSFMKMKNDVSISAIFYIAKSYGVVLN